MMVLFDFAYMLFLITVFVFPKSIADDENLNIQPRQIINEAKNKQIMRFRSPIANSTNGQDLFKLINYDENMIIVGARDALYNISCQTMENKYIIKWKALSQTIEECHMKGKSEAECHNFIRVATRLRNGRILLCGTHAFSPQCREYEMLSNEDRFVEREQYSGQAISPYNPRHNSTFVYDASENEIFVGTVSDIGANDALLYRKRFHTTNGDEDLRTPKDDRVIEYPQFVSSFIYKDYVYFWYRERAVESLDNNRESLIYSRVGRVCARDNGGLPPANDRFATFLKARLNCSFPGGSKNSADAAPFYFNELQSLSSPIEDGKGDALLFGVFHTSKSLLISAVCAFRMSQVVAIFNHGRFKTQRTPMSIWGPFQKFYGSNTERPGRCVPNTRHLTDVSFITKNPLMYDLIPSEGQRPILVEGPGRPAITALTVLPKRVNAVRNQLHYVIYVGRSDGTIGKLVDTSVSHAGVIVENVRAFNSTQTVIALHSVTSSVPFNEALIAMANDEVIRLPLHHCGLPHTCSACVRLRDPHCAWDVDSMKCVFKRDWTTGSYVQNILKGVSEQCPDFLSSSSNNNDLANEVKSSINDDQPMIEASQKNAASMLSDENKKYSNNAGVTSKSYGGGILSTTNLSAVVLVIALSSVCGFLIGYRISKWRMLNILKKPDGSGVSSNGNSSMSDEYEHYEQPRARTARLSRHNSFSVNPMLITKASGNVNAPLSENFYVPSHAGKLSIGSMGATATDAMSLVFNANNNISQQQANYMPLQAAQLPQSNGGSGATTPHHETRSVMLSGGNTSGGSTLHRDYKVKKVYL